MLTPSLVMLPTPLSSRLQLFQKRTAAAVTDIRCPEGLAAPASRPGPDPPQSFEVPNLAYPVSDSDSDLTLSAQLRRSRDGHPCWQQAGGGMPQEVLADLASHLGVDLHVRSYR
jgi:hypothetical protein